MIKKVWLFLLLFFPLFVSAKSMSAVEYIENIASSNNADKNSIEEIGNTGLAYDGTVDNNLRYVGKNINNYIDIGDRYKGDVYVSDSADGYLWNNYRVYSSLDECENAKKYRNNCRKIHSKGDIIYWRIIGVFYNIKGKDESVPIIKIIRDESIGDLVWDSSPYNINKGAGINEWSKSDLMHILNPGYENNLELTYKEKINETTHSYEYEEYEKNIINNSLYFNSNKGKVIDYFSGNYDFTELDFSSFGLSDISKKFIKTVYWNTGSKDWEPNKMTAYNHYEFEKNKNTIGENAYEWYGKIALMNASDYGFATLGGTKHSRTECLNIDIDMWWCEEDDDYYDCNYNNWITPKEKFTLLLNAYDSAAIGNYSWGQVYAGFPGNVGAVKPSFFINENTIFLYGDGSKDNPYKLALEEFNSTKLSISSKRNSKDIFKDIELSKINWKVEDESILGVDNGTIIPLKVGVTEIVGELDGVLYRLSVEVTEDLLVNPKTTTPIFVIMSILSIVLITIIRCKRGQRI